MSVTLDELKCMIIAGHEIQRSTFIKLITSLDTLLSLLSAGPPDSTADAKGNASSGVPPKKKKEKTPRAVTLLDSRPDFLPRLFDLTRGGSYALLDQPEVIRWLFNDLTFLLPNVSRVSTPPSVKELKVLEDNWGRAVMKKRRPDLTLDKQWTNKFGEHLCEEIYRLIGKPTTPAKRKGGHLPDLENADSVIEVKTQTFYTTGTAGEKILGASFKYAILPTLYGKPLQIICVGGAEKICREQYGNLPGGKCIPQKKAILDFNRERGVEYVGATDILLSICN